jgi:undecaprenyl-diphosphatase
MHPFHATLLGVVEGMTEFLPISSTGHLILTSAWLGLHGESLASFEVVLQAGALGAVMGLYRARVRSMWRGLFGGESAGRRLLVNVTLSALPALLVGAVAHRAIKHHLFSTWPVVAALAVGGVVMIGVDRWRGPHSPAARTLDSLSHREALFIGCLQCLALWPGMSRAMVTIVAGLLVGLPAVAAAEYSFVLAMPTLGAATLFEAAQSGSLIWREIGWRSILCGFAATAIVAAIAIRGFLAYLTRRGLAPFGWYRVGLAALIGMFAPRP